MQRGRGRRRKADDVEADHLILGGSSGGNLLETELEVNSSRQQANGTSLNAQQSLGSAAAPSPFSYPLEVYERGQGARAIECERDE